MHWSTNLRPFRDKYLAAELEFTKIHLLDTQIGMADRRRSNPIRTS